MTNQTNSASVWTPKALEQLVKQYGKHLGVAPTSIMGKKVGEVLFDNSPIQVIRGEGDMLIHVDWSKGEAQVINPLLDGDGDYSFDYTFLATIDIDPTDPDACIRACEAIIKGHDYCE